MSSPILGLHHVTATVNDAQADLDFSIDALGLRLVKKTVNFDNHFVYHFYYGDEIGRPGTIWTTFPYKGKGVPVGTNGAGQITVTSFSVPAGSLDTWRARLRERGHDAVADMPPRFGEESITVTDPSGLVIELIANDADAREPWKSGGVDEGAAVRGLHSVTLEVRDPRKTVDFMRDMLGFQVVNETEGRTRVAVNGDGPGKIMDVASSGDVGWSKNGLGTVHHVAMAIGSEEEQLKLRGELVGRAQVTPVRDRQYFKSIYFREPGGVLFEVATMQPGFPVDEPVAELGKSLKLPPWEEPNRRDIEKLLPNVRY
jgi:glyoxalase family protein